MLVNCNCQYGCCAFLPERAEYLPIVTEDDNTNIISFQVEGHTLDTGGELDHLTGLDLGETENSGDTITN